MPHGVARIPSPDENDLCAHQVLTQFLAQQRHDLLREKFEKTRLVRSRRMEHQMIEAEFGIGPDASHNFVRI